MEIGFHIMPPDGWIYKQILDINQPLDGRPIRMKSIFSNERTASMFLYYWNGKYYFKDHSSGQHGDAIQLTKYVVESHFQRPVSFTETIDYLKEQYKEWRGKYGIYKEEQVDEVYENSRVIVYGKTKSFEYWDIEYWSKFHITEELLKAYNVRAMEYFKICRVNKEKNYVAHGKEISLRHSYGFYDDKGELIKIYNPYDTKYKHVTRTSKVMGLEQLQNHKTCIIGSSLKDMLSLKSLGLKIDVIWPPSEKTLIPKEIIDDFRNLNVKLYTIFDNDPTGIKAMSMYKTIYGIDYIYVSEAKDVAELADNCYFDKFKLLMVEKINKKTCSTLTPV